MNQISDDEMLSWLIINQHIIMQPVERFDTCDAMTVLPLRRLDPDPDCCSSDTSC